jgi:hypothetical protein
MNWVPVNNLQTATWVPVLGPQSAILKSKPPILAPTSNP